MWYSTDTFLDCVPGCEEGYAFSLLQNDDGGICHQCSQPDCALDEERVLCTRHNDTYCRACPTLPFQNHQEFYSPGLCLTRCAQGYAQTDRTCQLCSQQVCGPGLQLSSDCYSPADRERLPSCIPCPPLALGAMFLQGCQTTCISGWMYVSDSNRTCVPCDVSGCPLGYQGFCAGGELQCTLCQWPLDRSKTLAGPGNCTVVCAPNYAPRFDHPSPLVCVLLVETPQSVLPGPPPPPGPAVAVVAWGVDLSNSNASMQSGFPTRTVPHT